MAPFIFSKNTEKGKHSFYLSFNGNDYFLFTQKYRVSNKDYFGNKVFLDDALNHSLSKSHSVRKTMTKLIPYIRYVEQEYGIEVLRKTIKNNKRKLNNKPNVRNSCLRRALVTELA